ncbi:hypothetical protein [Bacillus sp. 03113]|uniref:hypothetical protein n=1 Tax=Bacillus sp. 03113 TaxID=2578211 RepID=UPI001C65A4F2|nr:hypothetical protein [Bacillus sp. 03113]
MVVDNFESNISTTSSDVQDVLVPMVPQHVAYLIGRHLALVKNNPLAQKAKSVFEAKGTFFFRADQGEYAFVFSYFRLFLNHSFY